MNGTSADTFSPGQTTSRAMIATIFGRQAGSPVINCAMNFADVDASAWCGEAVRRAAIADGTCSTTLSLKGQTARAQTAAMLMRYLARCSKQHERDGLCRPAPRRLALNAPQIFLWRVYASAVCKSGNVEFSLDFSVRL